MTHRISRRTLIGTGVVIPATGALVPLAGLAQDATPTIEVDIASPVGDTTVPAATPRTTSGIDAEGGWPLYGSDLSGDKATTTGGISTENAATLQPLWEVEVGGAVSATPVISNGVTYVGSYDGNLYAIDLNTGELVWTYETGAAVLEPNLQIDLGITGSAAVVNDVVYVGDAAAVVHAIDAASGEAIWTSTVDDQENASIWSSPVVWNDRVYVGVASIAKEEGFRGSVVALDAASGEVVWQHYVVPEEADGAGVFAVPAIDTDRGVLYIGTQNAYSENEAPYGDPISILALDIESGEIVWAFNAPPNNGETAPTEDVGFSASPNLFSAEIDGERRDLVGNGQKSGDFWALDRDTGEVVWQATVSPAGFLGGMEGTSAVANGIVAVPATDWPEFEGPASGLVSGLDTATGEILWTAAQTAPTASPVAISDDIVLSAGMDGILHIYELATGSELTSIDLGSSVSGGIGVADSVAVLGAATPQFAPFVLPGNTIRAFAITLDGATPVAATPDAGTPVGTDDGAEDGGVTDGGTVDDGTPTADPPVEATPLT